MDGEEWRNVVGFEGKYMVSSYGRVASLSFPIIAGALHYCRKPHLLNATNDINGYLSVCLTVSKNKTKRIKVHRLVATAFIPNPENYNIINHKDEDKRNNRADNLEWCTCAYNIRYGNGIRKSTETRISTFQNCKRVAQIDESGNIIEIFPGLRYAAEKIERDYSAITYSINHNTRCAGYHWKFVQ